MSFTRGAQRRNGFPKPGEELTNAPGRHNREGWVHVADHLSAYIDGKQYKHMTEWSRPCAVCGGAVLAFEKTGATDANSRFSNRTCKEHRGLMPAFEHGFIAWDGSAVVAGPKCGAVKTANPAPVNGFTKINVEGGKYTAEASTAERERDEAHDVNVKLMCDLAALRKRYEDVFAELQVCKAKLAQYELPTAMQQIAHKMPWNA